ncbi:glycosyltransferase family 4 protein [Flavobacterium pectinovorum]|uniref:glycosyltransferase family 4 protein n=1 Tax=Flavobacterium pectinovorum TaxID=29533 RepID=UPI001FADFD41|nr:glycosyltransferase family 4 protein [Flavobacterium pectinovorum]MCI9843904.1 glycosyltransferase family 4 protein [Flavobacterium pectinovorum]
MRIVQIIDSLEAGGAERMAVNYANALAEKIEFSALVATRKEGVLKNQIDLKVPYLFLEKHKRIDVKAVFKLRKFIKDNNVDIIHAHSSSFFIAVLVKLTLPSLKIIWHDHYGISQNLTSRKNLGLKWGSLFFTGTIAVNESLKKWAESYLWCSKVVYFPNFILNVFQANEKIELKGITGKRIICVANLRPQKNHKLLIETAKIIKEKFPDWTFHLFGKDFEDDYSDQIKNSIKNLKLEKNIFFYGTIQDVSTVLKQCDIAVLPSISEGLPLSLLEYGLCQMPVVATNVGEIPKIIISNKEGLIVESNDVNQFTTALTEFIQNDNYRKEAGLALKQKILSDFSEESVIQQYILWLNF